MRRTNRHARNIPISLLDERNFRRASLAARGLYVCIWCLCDDQGYLDAGVDELLDALVPRVSKTTEADLKALLDELGTDLIRQYRVNDRDYLYIPIWEKSNQGLGNPYPSEHPPCVDSGGKPWNIEDVVFQENLKKSQEKREKKKRGRSRPTTGKTQPSGRSTNGIHPNQSQSIPDDLDQSQSIPDGRDQSRYKEEVEV